MAIPIETMQTLVVCRGPIAFETLEVYRRCQWLLPHVIVSAKEWMAERQRTAPWLLDLPADHVHYVQEYSDVEAVLQIAQEYQLDAIYPGYGFLAESATFAEGVQQAGLRFIGPRPETLRLVGDKDAAIRLARQLGIPTIPSHDALITYGQTHSLEATVRETVRQTLAMAQRYPGYAIRLKHPAGGGGKGQRVLAPEVLRGSEAAEAIRTALVKLWGEIGGSGRAGDMPQGVLLELNIPQPWHWEVQLFGDGDTVVHLAARDCSLQNHGYQKFIELALSPPALEAAILALDPHQDTVRIASLRQRQRTLERICVEALRLGQAIRLRGAATVEFLVDQQGAPYFLEVNPRIQVEHAVTEAITRVRGEPISLVEWQQRVAAGERLAFQQEHITWVGDAMEVRLNAWHEDLSPVLGGVLHTFRRTPRAASQAPVRIDAGGLLQRQEAWAIPSYDANFALVIGSGARRYDTLDSLIATLETGLHISGNAAFHTNLQPVLGLLTLMRALPPETAFRTDMSLLWMALVGVVIAHQQSVLELVPPLPRLPSADDSALCTRVLRTTLAVGFAHPSRLLTYYIKRLMQPAARPLAPLEVMWQLAAELRVPLYEEERQQSEALQRTIDALWEALEHDVTCFTALCGTPPEQLADSTEYVRLLGGLLTTDANLTAAAAEALVRRLLTWIQTPVPAISALLQVLESTQLSTLLIEHDDLSVARPAYLDDASTVAELHRLLRSTLRPAVLRQGNLLSPMEAIIYHRPEPEAPPFVEIGTEVQVGHTLALLEAMKMFTELSSPVDGVVTDILVVHGQGVKTGMPLFKIATQDTALATTLDDWPRLADQSFHNHFGLLACPST
jgi:acetyl/propionyl-CoA carboxylase alpha subunit